MATVNHHNNYAIIANKILANPKIIPEELKNQENLCAKVEEFVRENHGIIEIASREITSLQNRILSQNGMVFSQHHPIARLFPQSNASFNHLLTTYPALQVGRLIRKVVLQEKKTKETVYSVANNFGANNRSDNPATPQHVPIRRSRRMTPAEINNIRNQTNVLSTL